MAGSRRGGSTHVGSGPGIDPPPTAVLVLGLGNVLLGDEGLGVRALELLARRYRLPEAVRLIDGGTKGLALLPYVEEAEALLVLDAVLSDGGPGTLVRLEGIHVSARSGLSCAHGAGLRDLLVAGGLQGEMPERVVIWGMHPAHVGWGASLSPLVAAGLPGLVDRAADELCSWGVVARPGANLDWT